MPRFTPGCPPARHRHCGPVGGAALRRALEDDPAITTYFVEGGNHSLDTPEDYTIGLEALKDIVRKYEEAMR